MDDTFNTAVTSLLKQNNINTEFVLTPLKGGRNNKVYKLEAGDRLLLVKKYFYHPGDTRDRLGKEYAFLSYACAYEPLPVPRPFACDRKNRIGLYQFVEGRSFTKQDLTKERVLQAFDFFLQLNKQKNTPEAREIPVATEACLSIDDYFQSAQWRIDKLKNIECQSETDEEALAFINGELLETWNIIKERVLSFCKKHSIKPDEMIPKNQMCISPSDFGFHNALLGSDGKVIFLDFEYAGWDDPVKMLCDFFLQPRIPIPMEYFDTFIEEIYKNSNLAFQKERINVLFPLFQLKWCCLMLNEFLPVAVERRKFAASHYDHEHQKRIQLEKSKKLFSLI